jgi:hypothetical protein
MRMMLKLGRATLAILGGLVVLSATVVLSGELLIRYTEIGMVPMGSPIQYTTAGLASDLARALAACGLSGFITAALFSRWRVVTVSMVALCLFSLAVLGLWPATDGRPTWFHALALFYLPGAVLAGGYLQQLVTIRLIQRRRLTTP